MTNRTQHFGYEEEDLYLVRETFTGNGAATTFQLTGNLGNATFETGEWVVGAVKTAMAAYATKTTGASLYDSLLPLLRNRISVSSISAGGLVTLDYAPMAENFYIWYWYDLSVNGSAFEDYYRDEFVSDTEGEGTGGDLASDISTDTSAFNGQLSALDDTVQKALDTLDDLSLLFSGIMMDSDNKIGTPTYTTLHDWFNNFQSPGRVTGGVISDAGSSTVDVTAGTGYIRATDSDVADIKSFNWSAASGIAIAASSTRFIGVNYNAGSPNITAHTTFDFDLDTSFPLGRVVNEPINGVASLHILNDPWWVGDPIANLIERTRAQGLVIRDATEGGLIVSSTGTRCLAVTAGKLWSLLNEHDIAALDTNVTGTFEYYWYKAGEGWQDSDATQLSNTQWNDVTQTTLQNLLSGRFVNAWVYAEADDEEIAVLYGQAQYNTLAQAQAQTQPTNVPLHIAQHGILIGRIILKQGTDTIQQVDSAFTTTFTLTAAADHGNLAGLGDDDHTQYALVDGTRAFSGSVTIGAGAAGVDYTLTFNGEDADGVLTWMEDEDYFKFGDEILMDSTEKIHFRDTAIYINSTNDGYMDIVADTGIRLSPVLTVTYGGTGASTLTDHGVLLGSGTDAITPTAVGATGEYLAGSTGADPTWATLNQAAVSGLTTGSSPAFVTVKLSALGDGYVPYHVADATGLADSNILISGTDVNIRGVATLTENLGTYTEVDSASDITISGYSLTASTIRRDANSTVSYDFGAGYFGNFTVYFSVTASAQSSTGYANCGVMFFGNTVGTYQDKLDSNDGFCLLILWNPATGGHWQWLANNFVTDGQTAYDDVATTPLTRYFTMTRSGTTLTTNIYSDSTRATLVQTLTLTVPSTTYRYFQALGSRDATGTGESETISFTIENIAFEGATGNLFVFSGGDLTLAAGGISLTGQVVSTVATGAAPLTVASTTVVTNLNADLWDGYQFADYINQAVKTTSSPTFVTAKLSGLTDGYVPYHVADATGLANSVIQADTTYVGIACATTIARLEVEDGGTAASMLVKITTDDHNVYGLVIGNDTYTTTDAAGLGFYIDNSGHPGIRAFGSANTNQLWLQSEAGFIFYDYNGGGGLVEKGRLDWYGLKVNTDDATAADRGLGTYQNSTGVHACQIIASKSRNTYASPATIATNDYIMFFGYRAHDGTAYRQLGGFFSRATNVVGSNNIQNSMYLYVSNVNDQDPITAGNVAVTIDYLQNVKIGDATNAVCRLEVEDDATASSMLVKITQDDANVYGLVIGNDTYSTTDTNGLLFKVTDAGAVQITWTAAQDFTIGPSGDTDALKMDTNKDLYVTDGDLFLQAGGVTCGAVYTDATTGTAIRFGVDNTSRGEFKLYGGGAGVADGGDLFLYTSADHDTTIDYFRLEAYEDDLLIGTNGDPDALKLDALKDFYITAGDLHVEGGSIYLSEIAAAQADIAGKGQIWVKNTTPSELWYTDDAGTDFQLGVAAAASNPLTVGTDDSVPGALYLYGGDDTENGGIIRLYLDAGDDTTIDYFGIIVVDDDLLIGPNTDTDVIKITNDKDFYITAGDLLTAAGQTITQNASHDKQNWHRGKFTYNGGATAYTVKVTSAAYWVKDKFCWWDAELTTSAIGSPALSTFYYLYIDYSAVTMGTEITATELIWSSTAPTWNTTYACWMNGDDRCIFGALTNTTPTDIYEFFHDGGDYVLYADALRCGTASKVGFNYTNVQTGTTWDDAYCVVPDFCTKAIVTFGLDPNGEVAASYGYWRTNGQTGAAGHFVSRVDEDLFPTYLTYAKTVITDASGIIEMKWGDAGNRQAFIETDGWHFPIGM